ncbi:hypothetical protein M378DRAFT_162875 [Amanita muscaria Koide BX008]|uniref:Uncharacterized protein n=1 Tax=Amanita muscaria (strain Koide BX008) TaxID=946122 RepID=A0A0C2X7K8_AMAMK|nr:hypothetical protein M378DRAFT_162875 [Amanita muscaria Koide BX008]
MDSNGDSNGPSSSDPVSPFVAVGGVIGGLFVLLLLVTVCASASARRRPYHSRIYWHGSRKSHNVIQMNSMNFHDSSYQQAPPPYMPGPEICPPAHVHHHHHHQSPV